MDSQPTASMNGQNDFGGKPPAPRHSQEFSAANAVSCSRKHTLLCSREHQDPHEWRTQSDRSQKTGQMNSSLYRSMRLDSLSVLRLAVETRKSGFPYRVVPALYHRVQRLDITRSCEKERDHFRSMERSEPIRMGVGLPMSMLSVSMWLC